MENRIQIINNQIPNQTSSMDSTLVARTDKDTHSTPSVKLERDNEEKLPKYSTLENFILLIDLKWSFLFIFYLLWFIVSWIIFAIIWYGICYYHGDILPHLPDRQSCVANVENFSSAFLFSLETQQTIGYGFRHVANDCFIGTFTLGVQCVIGQFIQNIALALLIYKLFRPSTKPCIKFSKKMVVNKRNNCSQLMFRIKRLHRSKINKVKISASLALPITTTEGEFIEKYRIPIEFTYDKDCKNLCLIEPLILKHKIDKYSPIEAILANYHSFSIILEITAVIESTSQAFCSIKEYSSTDILWGYKFASMINNEFDVKDILFDTTKMDKYNSG